MKFTILVKREDDAAAPLTVSEIERTGPLRAASLGLTLAESKQLVAKVQQELVESQLACHAEEQRICGRCGHRRALKDYRPAGFKSLFGRVDLRVPRLYTCPCEDRDTRAQTVQIEGLENWVSPELEFVQSQLAATIPYARTGALLQLLLPVDTANATSTVRRHALSVGQRLDTQLRDSVETGLIEHSAAKSSAVTVVGLDSGYVRDCRPRSEGSFEVVVGRILRENNDASSLGFVRTVENNREAGDRLRRRLCEHGQVSDEVAVMTDRDAGLRTLLMSALPKARHILRLGHLTGRLGFPGRPALAR